MSCCKLDSCRANIAAAAMKAVKTSSVDLLVGMLLDPTKNPCIVHPGYDVAGGEDRHG